MQSSFLAGARSLSIVDALMLTSSASSSPLTLISLCRFSDLTSCGRNGLRRLLHRKLLAAQMKVRVL